MTGDCVATSSSDNGEEGEEEEEINWLLWGGVAVVTVLALTM